MNYEAIILNHFNLAPQEVETVQQLGHYIVEIDRERQGPQVVELFNDWGEGLHHVESVVVEITPEELIVFGWGDARIPATGEERTPLIPGTFTRIPLIPSSPMGSGG
jgi:hypothetical protein